MPDRARTPQTGRRAPLRQIDLNRASMSELMAVNGIGEVLAQRIIEYREQHKGFKSVNELNKVKGVGDKTFDKLRPFLMVADEKKK